ncbi:MAG: hypothetical protein ACR2HR_05275 [Euzebya sp.]
MTRLPAALTLAVLLLSACGSTPGDVLPDPRDGRSGIRLSGTLQDRQVAFSDGLPELNFGDCDLNTGNDRDFCIITRDINGELIVIVFENPDALMQGERLAVADVDCADPPACDQVTEAALIDVQVGVTDRVRAVSGQVTMEVIEPLRRYRGDFDIRLPDGSALSATFDVVPRPEELS